MSKIRRIFEILPAALAWSTLVLPFFLLDTYPKGIAIFVFLYVFLWFLRALEYGYFLLYSYIQYKKALARNWRLELKQSARVSGLLPEEVIHLIIMPTYKEPKAVLRESIQSIARSDFPAEQVWFCLATEERDSNNGRANAEAVQQEFGDSFGRFFWIEHPSDLPDEIKGKGANITFAAKEISRRIVTEGLNTRRVLVTTIDADNKFHPKLLSCLTYHYCHEPERHKRSFQPVPLFFNNIWEVPVINRMIALASGYWHLIESGRPDRLRNFSSHSQPLSALIEMDFWDKTTIVEDGRQYWRSYLHFNGKYEVIPVFIPIYQDAILNKNLFRSLVGQFNQLRRWAWGSSDVAYFTVGIIRKWRQLPKLRTLLQYYRLIEGIYMWATAAIFLAIATPVTGFLNPGISQTVFGSHISVILSVFFKIALGGIFLSMILTFLIIPPPPKKSSRISLLWQWILFPITTIIFGSLPALVTQTQLALGKKMEFNVTEKVRRAGSKKRSQGFGIRSLFTKNADGHQ